MRHFLVSPQAISGDLITFPASEAHHIKKVLRFKKGDLCAVLDGKGYRYEVELHEVASIVTGRILKKEKAKSATFISVAQAIPQKGKMETIVEKAAELGLLRLIPLMTERTQIRPTAEAAQKMVTRWLRIAEQTIKQSHSAYVPEIMLPLPLDQLIQEFGRYSCVLLFSPRPDAMEWSRFSTQASCDMREPLVLIGPEGGFSPVECEALKKHSVQMIKLEDEILKTDTAFVSIVSLLKYGLTKEKKHA
jgi:16S rRNA (uracil1498-N3)-methyltransferase